MESKSQEETTIQKARDGDREALEALFRTHCPRIRALVESRLGAALRSRLEVDDVLQETFLRALESISRFRPQANDSFFRWISGIAIDVIRNAASARANAIPLDDGQLLGPDRSPSRLLRRDERFDRLEKALQTLSPEYRQVLLLARVKGLSIEQVARQMKRSRNAVSLLLLRANRKLRATFGETESLHLPPRALGEEGDAHEG